MKKHLFLLSLFSIILSSCGGTPSISESESEVESESESEYVEPRPEEFLTNTLFEEDIPQLEEFTPTLFKEDTLSKTNEESLYDGVDLITYSFNLNNDNKVIATTLEVDLTKADIRTNYSPGAADTLYNQMNNFQSMNEDVDVIAGINADFFARGGTSVNAYIKDYQIIKSAHNDKGIYDYTNLDADIPASMPMLLGVQGEFARIAPIVENKSVEDTIKSSFKHKIMYAGEDKVVHNIDASFSLKVQSGTNKLVSDYTLVTKPISNGVLPGIGDKCYILKMEEGDYKIAHGKIEEFIQMTRLMDGLIYLKKLMFKMN